MINHYYLSELTRIEVKLGKEAREDFIEILSFIYGIDFADFYNPINNTYSNPDNILIDTYLEQYT